MTIPFVTSPRDDSIIDASPEKAFFVHILTRDISLADAINDLVDNSVDGARRLRSAVTMREETPVSPIPDTNRVSNTYDGLWVRLQLTPSEFRISDNCGGIPVDVARKYAFHFGRPSGMNSTPHSVGQFGVGMKRSLFKLGNLISIESVSAHSRFGLTIDVRSWLQSPDWEFKFSHYQEDLEEIPEQERGTTITVRDLHSRVAEELALENFAKRVRMQIGSTQRHNLDAGLALSVNTIPLGYDPAELLQSTEFRPVRQDFVLLEDSPTPITVQIHAGLGESKPPKAGWYVFCNGRLVLEANKQAITGWGASSETRMPLYHNQYARFRGYVYVDCDDAGLLPWSTTKTDLDVDSPIYANLLQSMMQVARPIITWINKVRDDADAAQVPLEEALQEALHETKPARLGQVNYVSSFRAPRSDVGSNVPKKVSIQYSREAQKIDLAKKRLNVSSAKEVGEKTFDYFFDLECEE